MKIAIVGGGASGLMAAIAAKGAGTEVVIYERNSRVGKKILATGNGRCNITNAYADTANYHGEHPEFINSVKNSFWVNETIDFFSNIGVLLKEEDGGKMYPYSDTASSVLDALRRAAARSGAITECGGDVKRVTKTKNGFSLSFYGRDDAVCDRVIIACGGCAAPASGSNGSGYELLRQLGHRITPLSPSLVQIKTETETVKKLKGIKVNANVTIGSRSERGEVLFTDYGLSGPPIFSLSAYLGNSTFAELDIMPEYSFSELSDMLTRRKSMLGDVPLEEFFTGMLNKRVGQAMLKSAGIMPLSRLGENLSRQEIKKLAAMIKCWRFEIKGTMSWNNAQVTHGGAATSGFDSETLESKLVRGMYACGEVLDIDGDCGGYNLQWAWSSGYTAGRSAMLSCVQQ